jgi:hypothetical protein
MKKFFKVAGFTIFTIVVLAILFPSTFKAQTRSYTDENVDYVLVLPSAQWRAISVPGIDKDTTEFRYGQEGLVKFRIRRALVDADVTVEDLIQRQQTLHRSSLLGYVKEKVAPITGHLSGVRYAYEYVTHGKPTARAIYYLEANNRTVYRLEFAGSPDLLRDISEQADLIAQSFQLK